MSKIICEKEDLIDIADAIRSQTGLVQPMTLNEMASTISSLDVGYINNLSAYVTPQMFGAIGDGVADDTAAIQAALDASSYVYIPDGTYMINATYAGYGYMNEGGIKPHSNQTIVMSQNATLKAIKNSTGFYNIVNLNTVSNVRITGGKVEGDRDYHEGTSGEHGHGVAIRACSDIIIDGVESYNCWGDSIDVGHYDDVNCHNIRIYNCKLHDSRRQGISITGCSHIIVRDCEIYNINGTNPQSGIDIEPDGGAGAVETVVIDCCKIYDTVGASIIIADTSNKIQTLRITNCQLDMVADLSGNDIVLNNNTINKVVIASDFINVANCTINRVITVGGNGRFYNCQFVNDTSDYILSSDVSNYPNKVSELLEFYGCHFRAIGTAPYLMQCSAMFTFDGTYPEKTVRFNMCKIEFQNEAAVALLGRNPYELIIENSDIIFAKAPYAPISVKTTYDSKVTIRDSRFFWEGVATYIIDGGTHSNYTFEIYNSEFSRTNRFLYVSSAGTAGGTIRLNNNVMSNTSIYNKHNFKILGSNTEQETIDKTLASLPKYNGGVN